MSECSDTARSNFVTVDTFEFSSVRLQLVRRKRTPVISQPFCKPTGTIFEVWDNRGTASTKKNTTQLQE
jgi:hypothetical protein